MPPKTAAPASTRSIDSFFHPAPTATAIAAKRQIISLVSDSDDGDAPIQPPKKPKLEATSASSKAFNSTATPAPAAAPSKVDRFRYDPTQHAVGSTATIVQPLSKVQQDRHRMFAERLSIVGSSSTNAVASTSNDPFSGDSRGDSMEIDAEMLVISDEEEEEEESGAKGKGKGKEKEKQKSSASKLSASLSQYASKDRRASTKTTAAMKPGAKVKYTPLEQQVLVLQKANPGVILMIEVGYKYRFFGEESRTASKLLNIACYMSQNMMTASVPTHRLGVHIKRLLSAGEKVGVVRQTETAALKKQGDNKSKPFVREVAEVYTLATYIDGIDSADSSNAILMCLVEDPLHKAANQRSVKIKIGLVAVMVSTGDIIYDEFEDGLMRAELETRLLHLNASELVLQKDLSPETESMIKSSINVSRTERIKKRLTVDAATSYITNFLTSRDRSNDDENFPDDTTVSLKVLETLPPLALIALASLIQHLTSFNLASIFYSTPSYISFSNRVDMTLNAATLTNLEIFQNQTDFTSRGSLIEVLDHTKTLFGKRLLRKWIARPLLSADAVNERLSAIGEILDYSGKDEIVKLGALLKGLPDLERGLIRIHLGKASSSELLRVLQSLSRISHLFDNDGSTKLESTLLRRIVESFASIRTTVDNYLDQINVDQAKEGNLANLYRSDDLYAELREAKEALEQVKNSLQTELKSCRTLLKKPALQYMNVAKEEYLVEIRIAEAKKIVPDNWLKVNGTKSAYRYRSPGVSRLVEKLECCQETLAASATSAFMSYLANVASSMEAFRKVIANVAVVDCLFSLALAALSNNYCRPVIVAEVGKMEVVGARHPMIETVLADAFVPNDINLGGESSVSQMILTGNNMNGKSSYSRSIALIALMTSIGSYVPATSCSTSLFDSIHTRMGASDALFQNRSTFMVELSETAAILRGATNRSLVILDELGRGTSTYDGLAIAESVLRWLVEEIGCVVIFVTHFPSIGKLEKEFTTVKSYHMSSLSTPMANGFEDITFLYRLEKGLASSSQGLNVARIANLPESVLIRARDKARDLELEVERRGRGRRIQKMEALMLGLSRGEEERSAVILAKSLLQQ